MVELEAARLGALPTNLIADHGSTVKAQWTREQCYSGFNQAGGCAGVRPEHAVQKFTPLTPACGSLAKLSLTAPINRNQEYLHVKT